MHHLINRIALVWFPVFAGAAAATPASCVQGVRAHFLPNFYPNMAAACGGDNTAERAIPCLEALRDGRGKTEGASGRPVIASGFWTLAGACAGGATGKRAAACIDFMEAKWKEKNPRVRYEKDLAYACGGDRSFEEAWSCAEAMMALPGYEPLHLSACQGGSTAAQATACFTALRAAKLTSPFLAGACGGGNGGASAIPCIKHIRSQLGILTYLPSMTWACAGGRTGEQAFACLNSRDGKLSLRDERDYAMACAQIPSGEMPVHGAASPKTPETHRK